MVWLPGKLPQICFGGETPNDISKFQPPSLPCNFSIHVYSLEKLNPYVPPLLYIDMFPREYPTSPNLRAPPHSPSSAPPHLSENCTNSNSVPARANLGGRLNGSEPLRCLWGTPGPATAQPHSQTGCVASRVSPARSIACGTGEAACRASGPRYAFGDKTARQDRLM